MFTKILPAGDLFRYLEGDRDSLGRRREFAPKRMRGDPDVATRVLVRQAPWGVRSRWKPAASPAVPAWPRPPSEWVRHCERHLVHFISCFHEQRSQVEAHLTYITRATEQLVLAGLPREALYSVWYEHPKTYGSHAHGGLLLTLLHNGRPYAPRLHPELVLGFDRLVSRKFGYADPLDPRGHRLVYAAAASARPENETEIRQVGELAREWWESEPCRLQRHQDFFKLLAALELKVLPAPLPPGRRAPRTVVVASRDGRRAIHFCGPLCRSDFSPEAHRVQLEGRRTTVAAMTHNPLPVFRRFRALLAERVTQQQSLWPGPDGDADRVTAADFAWLDPEFDEIDSLWEPPRPPATDGFENLEPLIRWGERGFPLASNEDLCRILRVGLSPVGEIPDLTDPDAAPLRELIEELLEREELSANEGDEVEVTEAFLSPTATPVPSPVALPEPAVSVSAPASQPELSPAKTRPRLRLECEVRARPLAGSQCSGSLPTATHLLELEEQRRKRRLALAISLATAQRIECDRRPAPNLPDLN